MNVLSLFDGMSCGQLAFDNLGIKFEANKVGYAKKFIDNMNLESCRDILDLDVNIKK